DNRLDLNIDLPDNTENLYIAPLLLLPFVENSFKHGASNMIEQPWISLFIAIENDTLKMNLVNGKPPDSPVATPGKSGIGIINARQRLSLQYPDRHQLTITSEEDVFIINLTLQLERRAPQSVTPSVRKIAEYV
ncbi:MAG: hypothetical protein JST39_16285, partial [Bacteroidetes bacterium]|nr:hypothetical protein [Bacteroidota bacterium]